MTVDPGFMGSHSSQPGLANEAALREFLEQDIGEMRERLEHIRSSWTSFSQHPEIPALPLPFPELEKGAPANQHVPDLDWSGFDILSLDVFDTCLWRITGTGKEGFRILEHWMKRSGQPVTNFAQLRDETENRIRKAILESGEREDVQLVEIYASLQEQLDWTDEKRDSWMQAEISLEAQILRAHAGIRKLAREAQNRGKTILYTTEMYLPAEAICHCLGQAGFPVDEPSVFASGDRGLSKGSGRLYALIKEAFPGKRILHLGDNAESDVRLAEHAGLTALHVPAPSPAYRDPASMGIAALVAEDTDSASSWERLGFGVVGPFVASWVRAVVEEAESRDLKKLLFLTRDGYFPQIAFAHLKEAWDLPMEAVTCFASRRLLGLASMDNVTAEDWDFLLKPAPGMRICDFFERVGIGREIYEGPCVEAGLELHERVCHHRGFFRPQTKDRLYTAFVGCMPAFYAQRDKLRERLLAYLASLGVNEQRYGILDLGWNGSSLTAIRRLLGDNGPAVGFYGALWQERQADTRFMEGAVSWLITGEHAAAEERLVRGGVALLEFLMGSPHESVVDVRANGEHWDPVSLQPGIVGPFEKDAYAQMERGCRRFLKTYHASRLDLARGDGKDFLRQTLQKLIYAPDPELRNVLGKVRHTEGWGICKPMRLLPEMTRLQTPDQVRLAYAYSGWKAAWRTFDYA